MKINSVEFLKSSSKTEQCPEDGKPEYAFVGRSNVGKSSLINALTGRKNLALTSAKPGKTRLINHYNVDNTWYLVDLPGYGYAQVSKKDREAFDKLIRHYLLERASLMCLFLLIDSRHPPLKPDTEFITWLAETGVPFVLVFTKSDKLSANQLEIALTEYKAQLTENWEELPRIFVTSAEKGTGLSEILDFIGQANQTHFTSGA
ncbi:MAG: YihA family ribosome biogenesis GTP-binding protein [Bacteroidota bacterium]|nr:MAG: YihA family ribosome biogenesis GTP-binding protein [Bacteroidota bacterium]